MSERRFTVGDDIRVTIDGTMTGITEDGKLTVQYRSELGACETTVELDGTLPAVKIDHRGPNLARIEAKDEARRVVVQAALRAAATCWPEPPNGEADALHRSDEIEDAIDAFDEALARYVELADA